LKAVTGYDITFRPDYILLKKEQANLEAVKKSTKVSTTPYVGAFGQVGYGLPGLDPFKTTFDQYFIVGLKLNWNIWNWNESKNQREIYSIQQDVLDKQIAALDIHSRLNVFQQEEEMTRLKNLIIHDRELIELRKSISKSANAQVDNGVITMTDYLSLLNEQYQAELALRIHELQLTYAYINYLTILGQ
jgi:outer membrane protein TolC